MNHLNPSTSSQPSSLSLPKPTPLSPSSASSIASSSASSSSPSSSDSHSPNSHSITQSKLGLHLHPTSQNASIQARYSNFLNRVPSLSQWSPSNELILLEPYKYLTSIPGKEIRSLMIEAFNHWFKIPKPALDIVKRIVGQLHTASLLMDDVEDGSDLRRGVPVAHKIYGVPQTINSANYVYFLAYQELSNLSPYLHSPGTTDLRTIVNEELLQLHRGQGMDLYWRDSLTCPTEDEYIQMVNNKTGGLFRIAIKMMKALCPLPDIPDYLPIVDLIGIIFQIRDDLLNLSSVYTKNKGFCEDLTEGKFSFPIVHALRADTTNHSLLNILRQRPTEVSTKAYAVSYMRDQTGSLAYTRDVLSCLEEQANEEVRRLGGNPALEAIFDLMHVAPSPPSNDQEVA